MTLTQIPSGWFDTEIVKAVTIAGTYIGLLTEGEDGSDSVVVGNWVIPLEVIDAMTSLGVPEIPSTGSDVGLLILVAAIILIIVVNTDKKTGVSFF